MKVKYQLAVAMSHKAELLILDEPTSGLDPVSRDELLDTFLTLCEQEGVSILFSTHITSDLDACADTITYIQSWPRRRQRKEAGADRRVSVRTGAGRRLRRGTARKAHRRAQPQGRAGRAHPRGGRARLAAGLAVSPANLEQIMVHLEREAEA